MPRRVVRLWISIPIMVLGVTIKEFTVRSLIGVRAFSSNFQKKTIGANALLAARFMMDTKSCPPPRFDDFSEVLIGKWMGNEDSVLQVEEVMRSCGGAVQGIREPLEGESVYLNRANDGFCFFQDGSYTMGPKSRAERETLYLSSLVFPPPLQGSPKRRLVIAHDSTLNPRAQILQKLTFGQDSLERSSPPIHSLSSEDLSYLSLCKMDTIVRCKMPSANQPWMMQRAKWESLGRPSQENVHNDDVASELTETTSIQYWVVEELMSSFEARMGLELEGNTNNNRGIVVHCGAVCPVSLDVRIVAREYSSGPEGKDQPSDLCGILYMKGTIST